VTENNPTLKYTNAEKEKFHKIYELAIKSIDEDNSKVWLWKPTHLYMAQGIQVYQGWA
jgi:hypothetical protein